MRCLTMLFLLTLTLVVSADIGLRFDDMGQFISPDQILQEDGVRSYKNNNHNQAMDDFKRSAKFGNEMSKYLIAHLYFEKQDLTTGYAWLKLLKEPIDKRDELLVKIEKVLSPEELELSANTLKSLKLEYNDIEALNRRNKWDNSLQFSGSHLRGIRYLDNRNLTFLAGFNSGAPPIQNIRIKKTLNHYMFEYVPQGEVHLGDIIIKDD